MNRYSEYENFIITHPWKEIHIENEIISYRQFGQGKKTILLLLGGSMFSADAYFKLILELETKYQLIMIDYPKQQQTIDSLINLIAQVIKKLKVQKVYVFGTNYGGGIAQAFSKEHPAQVEGLILYNTLTKTNDMSEHARKVIAQVIEAINELSTLREMMPLDQIKSALIDQINQVIKDPDDRKLYELFITIYQEEDEKLQMYLIKDLLINHTFSKEDFKYLKEKTLLFYAHDDDPLGGTELIETLADLYVSPCLAFVETDRFNLMINPYQMADYIKSFIK
jgi:pimeloyl-ACP methyl ester carboxylesterase